jgi:hypothetical protein
LGVASLGLAEDSAAGKAQTSPSRPNELAAVVFQLQHFVEGLVQRRMNARSQRRWTLPGEHRGQVAAQLQTFITRILAIPEGVDGLDAASDEGDTDESETDCSSNG